ncbi:site-specific integrase [uncultured Clostridium sp.]|uniref:site-specific integrase n=1 Tax=uncultured Clostridium sp. TaxID=59620 RepID=UPI0028EF19B2|nr:site-specific integrase [uncultured Clostridium sp.]
MPETFVESFKYSILSANKSTAGTTSLFNCLAATTPAISILVIANPVGDNKAGIILDASPKPCIARVVFTNASAVAAVLKPPYRCGLRLGEAFSITWDDVDLKNEKLDINKQVQYKNKQWYFTPPKYDSYRIIDLDNTIINILKKYKQQQRKDKIYYEEYYAKLKINNKKQINETDGTKIHLINVRENGTYIQPRVMQHCFHIIHHKLGIKKLDYHSLRHTHATMLLRAGANIKSVQERLGHKKMDITLDVYAHVTDEMRKKTLEILNKKSN